MAMIGADIDHFTLTLLYNVIKRDQKALVGRDGARVSVNLRAWVKRAAKEVPAAIQKLHCISILSTLNA